MIERFNSGELPESGKLLISEPYLFDDNFKRSVVLLCEHGEDGSLGFILNRKLKISLKDVVEIETSLDIPLYLGGPVQKNTLHYIHTDEMIADSSVSLGNGIYWGGDYDLIKSMLMNGTLDHDRYRFFLGYSGWGTGQLDAELEINSWYVTSTTPDIVFQPDFEKMWKSIMLSLGGEFKILANSPASPQLN